MARRNDWLAEHAVDIWTLITVFFFALGIVVSLGGWVFHWWDEPGGFIGPVSLLVGVASLGFAASGRQVREMRTVLVEGQARLIDGPREQTVVLQSVASILQDGRQS